MYNFKARKDAESKVPSLPRLIIDDMAEGEATVVLKENRAKVYLGKDTRIMRMSKKQALELAKFITDNYTGDVEDPKGFGIKEDE